MAMNIRKTVDFDPNSKTCFEYECGRKRFRLYRDASVVLNLSSADDTIPAGPQAPAIADPSGGSTVDTEARAALADALAALRAFRIISP